MIPSLFTAFFPLLLFLWPFMASFWKIGKTSFFGKGRVALSSSVRYPPRQELVCEGEDGLQLKKDQF